MVIECDGRTRTVKVAVTAGLVALVVFAACLVVIGQRIAPRIEAGLGIRESAAPSYGVSYDNERSAPLNQMPVNEAATREVKKGPPIGPAIDCPPCDLLTIQQLSNMPPSPQGPLAVEPAATNQRCSIAVFVGTDTQSQALLQQWNTDPRLQALKKQVNWHAYTKDNTLYRERYRQVVPEDQFPATIVTDWRGGHIYAAGKAALPATANAMIDAIQDAFDAYTEAQKQPAEPAPDTLFSSATGPPNCPDGECATDREPFLNPSRSPLLPMLRDSQPKNPIESILYWLWNPGEAVLAMLCALMFFALVAVVLIKVLKS